MEPELRGCQSARRPLGRGAVGLAGREGVSAPAALGRTVMVTMVTSPGVT